MLGRLVAFAGIVDPGELMDRANHGVRAAHVGVHGALNDMAEREPEIAIAASEQVERMGMAIQGATLDAVAVLDANEAVPVDELLFDGVAVGVTADSAAAFVM